MLNLKNQSPISTSSKRLLRIWLRRKCTAVQKMESKTGYSKTFSDGFTDWKKPNDFSGLRRRVWILNFILFALLIIGLVACSPSKILAEAASSIQQNSQSSLERFTLIEQEASAATPNILLIVEEAVGGQKDQNEILELTRQIHITLPAVEDQTPYWANLLQYIAIALIFIAVAWILWYTGIGSIIKRLFGFIPRPKRREADLAVDVLEDGNTTGIREWVAARRASDQEFDRAFKEAKRKRSKDP